MGDNRVWTKASASGGGNCVELSAVPANEMPAWIKASACHTGGCVEMAEIGDGIAVRDSKNKGGPALHFTKAEMTAFIQGCVDGEFDELVED